VCLFVHKHLGIVIESHRKDLTAVKFIEDDDEIDGIFKDKSIVKLFLKAAIHIMETLQIGVTQRD
jgi:hypothetical protein